jgi:hypothetical protein
LLLPATMVKTMLTKKRGLLLSKKAFEPITNLTYNGSGSAYDGSVEQLAARLRNYIHSILSGLVAFVAHHAA